MEFGKKWVNVAVQVLPVSSLKNSYDIVDQAIKVIHDSGVKYKVCPFETVMEGEYDVLMEIVKKVQDICYKSGANNMMCYVKVQSSAVNKVTIEDKIGKYS